MLPKKIEDVREAGARAWRAGTNYWPPGDPYSSCLLRQA